MSPFIRALRAHEEDTIEITWRLVDGGLFVQVITIPPKADRDAQQWAEQQVQERRQRSLGVEPLADRRKVR